MRTRYSWAYRLTPDDVKDLARGCQFFLDTNVLLSLYRVDPPLAKKIIGAIARVKDRVAIPNHAATEYHWKLIECLVDRINKARDHIEKFSDAEALYQSLFSSTFREYLSKSTVDAIKGALADLSATVIAELEKAKDTFAAEYNSHEIGNALSRELTECVLPPLSDDDIAKIKDDFIWRVERKIPPGYKDASKEKKGQSRMGETNEAGDYIIWEEVLRRAAEADRDVILVSNEQKDDWIWKDHGLTVGPRWELRKEFFDRTGGRTFHIVKVDKFLELVDTGFTEDELHAVDRPAGGLAPAAAAKSSQRTIFPALDYTPFTEMLEHTRRIEETLKRYRDVAEIYKGVKIVPDLPAFGLQTKADVAEAPAATTPKTKGANPSPERNDEE